MPRKPREEMPGGVYHVYARGNARARIFRDDADYALYAELLRRVVRGWRWSCSSYCLMPNHIHLLIETTEPNLGEGMQRLQSLYAQVFNATYGRSGHLFQGRFGAVRIRTQAQLDAVLDYIALNPVEAGLCGTPEDWPWSSSGARPELVSAGLRGLA